MKTGQKHGKGGFAYHKQRPPLSAEAEEAWGLGLGLGTREGVSRRPRPGAGGELEACRPGRPGARGCDLIGRRRPAGP